MVTRNNRSTRKTDKALQDSMLKLMQRKKYQLITVQDVIDEADVCRTTFYAHYRDIYDLVDCIENSIISEFSCVLSKLVGRPYIDGEHPIFTMMIDTLKSQKEKIILLAGENGDINFQRKLSKSATEIARQIWVTKYGSRFDEEKYLLCSSFVVSGCLGVISTAFERGIEWPAEKLAFKIGEIVVDGERLFFEAQE